MSVSLRAAGIDDVESVTQFMSEYYAYDHIPFHQATAARAARALIEDPRLGKIFFVCNDDNPIGYVVLVVIHGLEFGGLTGWIDELYLREEHRGKGITSVVIATIVDECRASGIVALRLEVERSNSRARAVYEKLGFKPHERDLMTQRIPTQKP